MSPLAEAVHDAFFAMEGSGLMGADLWEAVAEELTRQHIGFMDGV